MTTSDITDLLGKIPHRVAFAGGWIDFDIKHKGGQFPCHIETCNDPEVARWLSSVLYGQYFAEHPEVVETSQRIERG